MTPTPHNAAKIGDIAQNVLMCGDPLRAKMIADTYLQDVVQFNEVRGMYGFTGTFEGKRISVMGHGMGIPSIGIYSYELYNFYGVETIVRLGTCGALSADTKVGTVIVAESAITDSNYGYQYHLPEDYKALADPELMEAAQRSAATLGIGTQLGQICSSDVFYNDKEVTAGWGKQGVLGVEMEAYGLYVNAFAAGKKALAILTVSDNIITGEELTSEQRQKGLHDMIRIALGMQG